MSAIDSVDESFSRIKHLLPDDFWYNNFKPKAQKELNKQWASHKDGASVGDSKTLNTTYKGTITLVRNTGMAQSGLMML